MTKTEIVEVIENFYDKVVDVDRSLGDIFEVDQERLLVLLGDNDYKRAFVKVVDKIPPAGDEDPSGTEPVDFSKLKKDELKVLLTERGISFDDDAKKDELLALLVETD